MQFINNCYVLFIVLEKDLIKVETSEKLVYLLSVTPPFPQYYLRTYYKMVEYNLEPSSNSSQGFFKHIRQEYGMVNWQNTKTYFNLTKKLASMINRRIFLLRCRTYGVFPKHITNNVSNINNLMTGPHPFTTKANKLLESLKKSILNIEIDITCWKIKQLRTQTSHNERSLRLRLPQDIFENITKNRMSLYSFSFNKIKDINCKKFNKLIVESSCSRYYDLKTNNYDHFVKNFTNLKIPTEVNNFLALGPNFSLLTSTGKLPIPIFIKDLEHIIKQVDSEEIYRDILRLRAINVLTNYNRKYNNINKYKY